MWFIKPVEYHCLLELERGIFAIFFLFFLLREFERAIFCVFCFPTADYLLVQTHTHTHTRIVYVRGICRGIVDAVPVSHFQPCQACCTMSVCIVRARVSLLFSFFFSCILNCPTIIIIQQCQKLIEQKYLNGIICMYYIYMSKKQNKCNNKCLFYSNVMRVCASVFCFAPTNTSTIERVKSM